MASIDAWARIVCIILLLMLFRGDAIYGAALSYLEEYCMCVFILAQMAYSGILCTLFSAIIKNDKLLLSSFVLLWSALMCQIVPTITVARMPGQ